MSATSWLKGLNSFWTPTSDQFDGARSHRAQIASKLDASVGVFGMFEIGSLRHGTGIWRHSDADFLASMKGSRPASPWTTLNKVKSALQERFFSTTIVVRQPAVVCHFTDGVVEVVPGFYADSGYWVPDPTGGWMKTYPENHNKYVNDVNKRHDGGAKALARQLKIWKYERNVPVSSCYLEMRAAKHMDGEASYSAISDLATVFNKLHEAQLAAMNDPTGLGSRFTACSSDATLADALSKLVRAKARADLARTYWLSGDDNGAIAQLRLLFNHNY